MSSRTRTIATVAAVLAAIALVTVLALGSGGDNNANASETDGAFITGMVPHHKSAVEMAQIALKQAEHPETKKLARDIVSAQNEEIGQLTAAHQRIFNSPLPTDGKMHGDMGLSQKDMNMSMDTSMLKGAKPFDREFIDMMVPHHQSAIKMARVEIDKGGDSEMKKLAEMIIVAQSREIKQMNEWRTKWYGKPSPAGGVPAKSDTKGDSGSMGGMGH